MTHTYRWVQWNRHKRVYDAVLLGLCLAYLAAFVGVSTIVHPPPGEISTPILLMRAFGTLAILLLHVILIIGPLARFTTLAAPLLYNRRHLGVVMFLAALVHSTIALGFYGGFGVQNPASAVLSYGSLSFSGFAFEFPGLLALIILFVMAATSHDFWLANLSPRSWKSLHMLVYVAYGLLLLHVGFGVLQSERDGVYPLLLGAGLVVISSLHIAAGRRERRRDLTTPHSTDEEWIDVGDVDEIADGSAKVVCLRGSERIAVFRYGGRVSAVSNVCPHQGGPLGEGRVIDGCITCPWHGYQFLPENGQSPPPYSERIPTYEVRLEGRRVLLSPRAHPPGPPLPPAMLPEEQRS